MRKLFILSASLAVIASPAFAAEPSVTGAVEITGRVTDRCMFTLGNGAIPLGLIAQDVDGKLDTSKVNNRTATLRGWCNHTGAKISVLAKELTNEADAPTGFDNRVDYTATATTGSVSASDSTLVAGTGESSPLPLFTGDITVTLSNAKSPNNGLMVAGTYSGDVQVTLSPLT